MGEHQELAVAHAALVLCAALMRHLKRKGLIQPGEERTIFDEAATILKGNPNEKFIRAVLDDFVAKSEK